MKMLFIISWRNIWRTPSRSAVIITAVALGLLAGGFISAVSTGLINQAFESTIYHQVSHIQIHNPDFIANPDARHLIEGGSGLADKVRAYDEVKAVSERVALNGMIASAGMSSGVRIAGVDPGRETETTRINEKIVEGTFFTEPGRLPSIIIGQGLADKLNSSAGSRVVMNFQDAEGGLVSASFRVEGIFSVVSTAFEERTVYVRDKDMQNLIGVPGAVTEIAVLLEDGDKYRPMTARLQSAFPEVKVRNWEELAPDLYYQREMVGLSLIWVMVIILIGVAFGILNTILMSVLERTRELGMLMSIGMKKIKVFSMVLMETALLSVTGGCAGLLLSFAMVKMLSRRGLDLSIVGGENFRMLGMSPEIYPDLEPVFYLQVALLLIICAVLSAVYPALKAVQLEPAEAVRKE